MPKTMKAAVMYGPNDVRIEQVDYPKCEDGGMILKVEAIGLCGSDIRNLTTDSRKGEYPHIYGHEHVGVIVEVGKDVKNYKVGDRIFALAMAPCLKCRNCRAGRSDICLEPMDYFHKQGGFAEYMPIPAIQVERGNLFTIPEDVDFAVATLGEPISPVYSCQQNIDVTMGDVVCVCGAGPIGCFHAQIAKMRGAKTVIAVEPNQKRLDMIKKFGADILINSSEVDPVKAVLDATNGVGADKVITANPSVQSQQQSVYMVKPGGTICWFGGVPKGVTPEIDTNRVHYNQIWIYGHGNLTSIQSQEAYELAINPAFHAERYISHIMKLDDIMKGVDLAKKGEALKVVIVPSEDYWKELENAKRV